MTTEGIPAPQQETAETAEAQGTDFEAFYTAYAGVVQAFAGSRLSRDNPVIGPDDVAQEVLLRAWKRGVHAGDNPPRPWLFTVARRYAIDEGRRAAVRPQPAEANSETLTDPQDDIAMAENRTVLAEAIGKLTPDHQQVIAAMYLGGHSVKDCAETIGVPAGTIKSRAFYALRELRKALEEKGITGYDSFQ